MFSGTMLTFISVLSAVLTGPAAPPAANASPAAQGVLLQTTAPAQPGENIGITAPPNLARNEPVVRTPNVGARARSTLTIAPDLRARPARAHQPASPLSGAALLNVSSGLCAFDTSVGSAVPPDTLGGHMMTAFGPDPSTLFSDVSSLTDPCPIPGDIAFSTPVNHRVIGSGWMGWSHGYTGDVYYTNGETSLTVTLPVNTCAFYFYVEPNPFEVHTITVTADDGSSTSFDANGSAGAAYCGVYGQAIGSVTISSVFDFAVGEFGIACMCNPIYRACCYESAPPPTCVDLYEVTACIAEGGRWSMAAEYCSQLNPPCGQYTGACCEGEDHDYGYEPFQCIGDMLQWECLALGEATNWTGGRSCSDASFWCPGLPGVLYCPSSPDNPSFRWMLSDLLGLPVDFINTANTTPTTETLADYRAVLTWANYPYADNETFGNNLADYVDRGGRVILGQWCLPTRTNHLAGRIMTAEYCPALATSWGAGSYNGDGMTCATVDVFALTTGYLDLITGFQPGAMYDGTIGDSYAAIWRPDMAVWYSPGNLGGAYESGDWAWLTYNEVVCTGCCWGACCNTATTECIDDVEPLDCLAMGSDWRWRMSSCREMNPPCGNPGACCDIHTGECVDDVLKALCTGQHTSNAACGELEPACGDPGCCCDRPESGTVTDPHFAYRANCVGRFIPQEAEEFCMADAFTPACGTWVPTGVMYCPANADGPDFRAALSALLNSPVDYVDVMNGTPTVEQMSQYAAVFTWVNYPYADNIALGNNLADYVDMGGRAILGQWCFPTARNYLAGRIMDDPAYCPIASGSGFGAASYNNDGTMCATMNVNTLDSDYVDEITALQHGATSDGTIGSSPVASWNSAMNVWYSAGNLGGTYETGDWAQLTANEVVCANAPSPCCNIFTAECLDGVLPVPCFGMGEGWKWSSAASCATMIPPCGSPGACCDIYTGECADDVLKAVCQQQGRQATVGVGCSELTIPCGDPGCCCERPEEGVVTDPIESLRENCDGRFISGATGEACVAAAFDPLCGFWHPTGVLYCPANADGPEFRAALSALLNAPVDYFDAVNGTPTLENLAPYAAVFTWVNYPYADNVAMGNVLADFVDGDGRVILGQWCFPTARNYLAGRIMEDPTYCPIASGSSYGAAAYNGDGVTCWTVYVTSLSSDYVDVITGLQHGAITDGTIGASPLVALNASGSVIYSAGNLGGTYETGEWTQLTANEVICPGPSVFACCDTITAMCLDIGFVECRSMGPQWRAHPARCHELHPPCGDPGACCDPTSGVCIDDVLAAVCTSLGRQAISGAQCGEMPVPCGDPGCCCDYPETSEYAEPHFAFRENCVDRFISGLYPLCGDLDLSLTVDLTDYDMFLDTFGKCAGQAGYNELADLDGDNCITMIDFQNWRNCYLFPGPGCESEAFDPPCGTPCHDAEIVGPGAWSGTTCGMYDNCALRAGEDIIVKVEIPTDGNWQFALCGGPTTWDTYIYLGTACCQSTWYDDDGCGTVLSRIQRPGLTAGTYYLDIEPYSSTLCGDIVLDVSSYEPERTTAGTSVIPQQLERLRPQR